MGRLVVREGTHGRGVFTLEAARKGTSMLRYGGPFLRYMETSPQTYCVQIGPDLYLGASGGIDDYVNHSCEPNCALIIDGTEAELVAIRDIAAGEEVCFDYSTTMDEDDFEMPCQCGTPSCRTVIRDGKHLPEAVWAQYSQLRMLPEYVRQSRARLHGAGMLKIG